MTKPTVYLSGPMTGIPDYNYPAFHANAAFLRGMGYGVISPAELDAELGINSDMVMTEELYHEIIKHDYAALLKCDAIAFMPGFEGSRGAALESRFANILKLERFRVDADKNYLEKELIIGLTGYAQSGKNTLADMLVGNFGFEQRAFADSLRGILYALNPRMPEPNWAEVGDGFGTNGVVRVQDYIDGYGWEWSKKNVPEVRQLLQRLGTEGGREHLGENVWVDGLFNKPHAARLVTTDCRFPSEVNAVRDRGGIVVRVERTGYGPINSHVSETASLGLEDFAVQNSGGAEWMLSQLVSGLSSHGVSL